jgi:hypothetical protein
MKFRVPWQGPRLFSAPASRFTRAEVVEQFTAGGLACQDTLVVKGPGCSDL